MSSSTVHYHGEPGHGPGPGPGPGERESPEPEQEQEQEQVCCACLPVLTCQPASQGGQGRDDDTTNIRDTGTEASGTLLKTRLWLQVLRRSSFASQTTGYQKRTNVAPQGRATLLWVKADMG
ncbi:hypothetical protein CKAH01_01506 [Colletotrichum kahawae]|uniref:Uncharacterized protein n=1 Tax=Colletotrichum kahawae TaxID=34407 RepID=A0AAD9Y7T8_COLKA|nr:hypothetical protein CKAH01_01506 [Colletotrichum kahawae]